MQKFRLLALHHCRAPPIGPIRKLTTTTHRWFKPSGTDTGIRIYNCTVGQQVPLILTSDNYVTWYTCGPTVYDSMHLGHASCYVKLDIIQRILRQHFGLNIVTAMNITDIDDKIIARSQETGKDWSEIARFYEAEFWSDLRRLNVLEPKLKVRVTDHVPKIIAFIEDIIRKGCAYVGKDSSVYFDVKKFPIYGKLQKVNLPEEDESKSENKSAAADFALWKARKSEDEPSWPSPWGEGRPGWHIECSTLASMIFGSPVDIHAGGLDLKFPHHENEEAQCCVYHDTRQWVNYWLHTGHLNIKGQTEKMSKSLKNTITVTEMLDKNSADDFRMLCALSNYKNGIEYGDELMETARNTLNKFKTFRADCQAYLSGKKSACDLETSIILKNLCYARNQIDACIKEDFDTARSISVLLDQISGISRCINKVPETTGSELQTSSCLDSIAAVDNYVQYILRSFGFSCAEDMGNYGQGSRDSLEPVNLDGLLEGILQSRKRVRDRAVATKDKALFQICDELRDCLRQHGIEIRDHSQGSSWTFKK